MGSDAVRLTTTLRAPYDGSTIRVEKDGSGKDVTTILGAHPDTKKPITFKLRRAAGQDFDSDCARLKIAARRG